MTFASIIIQLAQGVIPSLGKLAREISRVVGILHALVDEAEHDLLWYGPEEVDALVRA